MGTLIVFIDSLRHQAELTRRLEARGFSGSAFVPPLAFSANILPLLFQGATPDELGFYNEYGMRPAPLHGWLAAFDPAVEFASRSTLLRKVIYRALRMTVGESANIPLRQLPFFRLHSVKPYDPAARPVSLMHEFGFSMVLASRKSGTPPARDAAALAEAAAVAPSTPRLYVSLNDLDAISHAYGLDSPEYGRHEDLLEEGLIELVRAFREAHGADSPVVILSDHGMADVSTVVDGRLEPVLGPSRGRYQYFLDATLLRFWSDDAELRERARRHFASMEQIGSLVTRADREEWSMTDRGAGDLIFVLHEGVVFDPNFMGRGVPLAMHGYRPECVSQHATFLVDAPEAPVDGPLRGTQPYHLMRRLIMSDAPRLQHTP